MRKQFFLLFILVVSISFINGHAASVYVNIGNLRYTVDTEAQTAELYGPASSTTITNLEIPDFIDYNGSQIPVPQLEIMHFPQIRI